LIRRQDTVATGHFREGLIQGGDGDYPLGIAWNLIGLMRLARRRGRLTAAAWLVGGLEAFSELMQALPPAAVAAYEADVTQVQTSLGRPAFTSARQAGRDLPLGEMIDEVAALADELMSAAK
jgi:hypothetical protein